MGKKRPKGNLTAQQKKVLGLIYDGGSREYIAQELGISPNTVHSCVRRAAERMGLSGKTAKEVAAAAKAAGYLGSTRRS